MVELSKRQANHFPGVFIYIKCFWTKCRCPQSQAPDTEWNWTKNLKAELLLARFSTIRANGLPACLIVTTASLASGNATGPTISLSGNTFSHIFLKVLCFFSRRSFCYSATADWIKGFYTLKVASFIHSMPLMHLHRLIVIFITKRYWHQLYHFALWWTLYSQLYIAIF